MRSRYFFYWLRVAILTDCLGELNFFTEKNKLAPSQFSVPLVFDKKWGIIPFYSEYLFLKEKTKTERKFWPTKNLIYPFAINTEGNSRVLTVVDPTTNNILYKSSKVMESKILERYNTEQEFRYWFDKAVEISVEQRIKMALFRNNPNTIVIQDGIESDIIEEPIPVTMFQTEFAQAVQAIDPNSSTPNFEDEENVNPFEDTSVYDSDVDSI